jgi:hypothetical protein
MWLALVVLGVLIVVSLLYSGMPAYRHLRAYHESEWREHLKREFAAEAARAESAGLQVEDELPPEQWYTEQIKLERRLYGPPREKSRIRLLPRWRVDDTDLQDLLDRERIGVYVSQSLFLVVIALLLAARLS